MNLQIPRTYHHLLPSGILDLLPTETKATCDNCTMCQKNSSGPSLSQFSERTKCCTYHPDLPNYAVGGILSESEISGTAGLKRICDKITSGIGVHPLGIFRPRVYALLYKNGTTGFGKADSLRCPYYEKQSGMCSIWNYREAVCSTFFCKYEDGEDGRLFWEKMHHYLRYVESLLTQYALAELGWSPGDILTMTAATQDEREKLDEHDLDETPIDSHRYRKLWGRWAGREKRFYMRSFEIVKSVSTEKLDELGGFGLSLQKTRLITAAAQLRDQSLPTKLVRNPNIRSFHQDDEGHLVFSYNANDPTVLSNDVFRVLFMFDGNNDLSETVKEIESELNMRMTNGLIKHLYRKRILVDSKSLAAVPQFDVDYILD